MSPSRPNIVIDSAIPYIKGILEPYADVYYMDGRAIEKRHLQRCDCLVVRTRTIVSRNLLEGTPVGMVATATIGEDHIDREYCHSRNTRVVSAPGSNAGSVAQYIAAAVSALILDGIALPREPVVGIIGAGNVGTKADSLFRNMGFRVLLNDPPREKAETGFVSTPLETLLEESDIITMHVPLTHTGPFATSLMAGPSFFGRMRRGALFINSSRGGVVDEKALLNALAGGIIREAVLDVWQGEPSVDYDLLRMARVATPHIAGYSAEGKANAATAVIREIAAYLDLPLGSWSPSRLPEPAAGGETIVTMPGAAGIYQAILSTCRVDIDTEILKRNPKGFEDQRSSYPVRREFGYYLVAGADSGQRDTLQKIGFNTVK